MSLRVDSLDLLIIFFSFPDVQLNNFYYKGNAFKVKRW